MSRNVEYDADGRRHVILWKAERCTQLSPRDDATAVNLDDERIDPMPTVTEPVSLSKRAIDRPPTEPPASRPRTEAEVEQLESEWAPLLSRLHEDIQTMRADPDTPDHRVRRHEKSYGELHAAYVGLRDPETARRLDARTQPNPDATAGEAAMLQKCEALSKADPSLSPTEQFRRALDDPEIRRQYFADTGRREPVAPPSGVVNAPERKVIATQQAPTDGLAEATALAREIQTRDGVGAAEAYRRAMRDPRIAAAYAAERGPVAAA